MSDYIVRATAANGQIRAFAIQARAIAEEARRVHNTSPVVTAAQGRLLLVGAMMGVMMKGEKDILTLQIKGGGPVRSLTVTADSKGRVKGYPGVSDVFLHANAKGKLDVSGAIGQGTLTVIKDMGLKEPYSGTIDLVSGEIGEDFAYYFASSEQVPSAVGLGVLTSKDNTVKQAGGFIIQLMPLAEEKVVAALEEKLRGVQSVTDFLEQGDSPEQLLDRFIGDMEPELLESVPVGFHCDCSKERVSSAMVSIGEKELQDLIAQNEPAEAVCQFCNKKYHFSVDELKELLAWSKDMSR